eukprot:gnl/Hemi2/16918_TR5620_c0_g1_i1.p1 gnl/Hemi2/16918_TR5620_c0_g1~~gnl/Hemi2/16918_TR5620_c0_g1_i1.p1  ORF type:complete len:237 (+),score=43.03 gnl/Hemi2/16918_TR5620_c0_g1_i1:399-1109(+)
MATPGQQRHNASFVSSQRKPQKIPCLVLPAALNFLVDAKGMAMQTLTLYNPYDFVLHYKVLSTTTQLYHLKEPTGTLRANSSIDLVLRFQGPNTIRTDKFLVEVRDAKSEFLGKKVVVCNVMPNSQAPKSLVNDSTPGDDVTSAPPHLRSSRRTSQTPSPTFSPTASSPTTGPPDSVPASATAGRSSLLPLVMLLAVVLLMLMMFLPAQDSSAGSYQLWGAFFIGMLVMFFQMRNA